SKRAVPLGEIAYRVNLFSAVMGAGTAVGLFIAGRLITNYRFIPFVGALALVVSPTFWSQAIIAEVYTAGAAFIIWIIVLLLWWAQSGSVKASFAAGFLGGLSLGVHMSVVLLAPDILPWIQTAYQQGFGIAAFNANTMEQMQSIVLAAQAENAPVIIQVSHRALQYTGSGCEIRGLQYMAAIGKVAAASVDVPVSLHLDHANENEVVQAIALGFTSVMFDGDGLPFAENIVTTKRLCEIAHSVGVCMEAEIGEVPKPDGAAFDPADINLTTPEDAEAFVNATSIDMLAIALGSVHGLKDKSISLDLERLQAIRERVDTPLVLHGSSGVNDEDIAQGINLGLAKINIATQLSKAFTGAVREVLAVDEELVDPRKYLGPGRDAQIEVVRERLRFVGAAG
ncbi:MAG: ketose-bisphosphate aldolase, partial [Aquificales bacterium]|nr:ketose-bisphosphate aldolase [Aquificales bacterium]